MGIATGGMRRDIVGRVSLVGNRLMRLICVHLVGCVASAALACGVALGQGASRSVLDAASEIPADVDLVVAIDDARGFVRSDVGATIIDLARVAGGFGKTADAWARIAGQLRMTPERATEALLGGSTFVAARWTGTGGMSWALLTEIDRETERAIVKGFRPLPRALVGGRPVLAVEGGALHMVLCGTPDRPLLMLGPALDGALFMEMAGRFDEGPRSPLSGTSLFREIERVGRRADAMLFFRSPGERDLWFSVLAARDDHALDATFLVGVPGLGEHGAEIEPWSLETFNALAEEAYVAVLDMNHMAWDGGAMGGGGAVWRNLLPAEMSGLLADRFALVVRPGEDGPLEAAVALETMDTTAMAQVGDRALGRFLGGLVPTERVCDRLEGHEMLPATSRREIDMSAMVGAMGLGGWAVGPRVSWESRIDEQHCNAGQHRGWWTVGLGTEVVEEIGDTLVDGDEGGGAVGWPWLSLGVVRPSALFERLEASGVGVPPGLEPLRGVREVTWQALESGRGIVQGFGRIEVHDRVR